MIHVSTILYDPLYPLLLSLLMANVHFLVPFTLSFSPSSATSAQSFSASWRPIAMTGDDNTTTTNPTLGVFVSAKQAAAAGVAESNSGLCNIYDKREWYQHQRVRGGRACRKSSALSPSGQYNNAADDRSRQCNSTRAADEHMGGTCVCHAHACVPCEHLAL